MTQMIFRPAQICARESRNGGQPVTELGVVRSVDPGRVVIATIGPRKEDEGIETFNPAFDTGWRLCG